MSAPLTASESALLRRDGEFMMRTTIPLMTETMCWGFHILLLAASTYTLWKKGVRESRARLTLLLVIIAMFVMSTTLLALDIYGIMIQIKGIQLTETLEGQSAGDKVAAINPLRRRAGFAGHILFGIEFLLGDAVVIWRTWALWADQRIVMIAPVALCLGSLASLIGYTACSIIARFDVVASYDDPGTLVNDFQLANYAFSIAANAASTVLIAWKAWQHRRLIKESFGLSAKTTQVERMLALILETGCIYLILWGLQIMSAYVKNYGPLRVIATTLAYAGNQIVGIYPTVIIILVEMQRTIWDSPEISARIMTTVHFASRGDLEPDAASSISPSLTSRSRSEGEKGNEQVPIGTL